MFLVQATNIAPDTKLYALSEYGGLLMCRVIGHSSTAMYQLQPTVPAIYLLVSQNEPSLTADQSRFTSI